MKQAARFIAVVAIAASLGLLVPSTFGESGHWASAGSRNSFQGARYHGGGYHGGGWDGWHGGWGWRGWYPYWGLSFYYAPYYYGSYYYPSYYPSTAYYYPSTTYYAPPAAYSSQATVDYNSPPPPPPATYSAQQPAVDRPLSPTAVDRDSDSTSPPPPPRDQQPPQIRRADQGQSISVADVKALANAGLGDDVILSHIRNSQTVYHLTTAEIIDLKKSGVSEKVIDFMINTPSAQR